MERYVTRPGVVLTSICDEYMLLAAKAAREHCPYMTQLNESSAFLWRRLEQGADPDALEQGGSHGGAGGDSRLFRSNAAAWLLAAGRRRT